MYSLQTKTVILIAAVILGLLIFQSMRVNEKEEVIQQQTEFIKLQNNGYVETDDYTNTHLAPIRNIENNKLLTTQEEIYLNSKMGALEVEVNNLKNQLKAVKNENKNLRSQITHLKEQRNLKFKGLHEKYGQEDNKSVSSSKPSTMPIGYKESFQLSSETLAI